MIFFMGFIIYFYFIKPIKIIKNWKKIVGIKEDIKELAEEIKEVIQAVKKTRAKRKA